MWISLRVGSRNEKNKLKNKHELPSIGFALYVSANVLKLQSTNVGLFFFFFKCAIPYFWCIWH